jgi:membrane protein YdbS with pleckstrin-like domain
MSQDQKKKPLNKWMQLINIPFQMGLIIVAFAYSGKWLDEKYPNDHKAFTIILTLSGVFIALYLVISQVNKLNKDE